MLVPRVAEQMPWILRAVKRALTELRRILVPWDSTNPEARAPASQIATPKLVYLVLLFLAVFPYLPSRVLAALLRSALDASMATTSAKTKPLAYRVPRSRIVSLW